MASPLPREMLEDHFASEPSSHSVEGQDDFSYFLHPSSVIIEKSRRGCKVGEGSYAKVYRGMYQGKSCAVKVFKEGVLKSEVYPKGLDKKGILSICSLKNPNIVHIYGLWNDPHKGRHALSIVMELCDCSLHEYIKGHRARGIPQEIKLKILHDITNGMIYLHSSKGMVHGDLRSSNVLLLNTKPSGNSANEQALLVAKLADFDFTQKIDPKSRVYYTDNFADEDYLPPEVFIEGNTIERKRACLTFSADVFCFGPLAIELACMEYPKPALRVVQKKKKLLIVDEIERRKKHLDKCKFPDRMYTELIVRRCMAQNPEERGSFLELQSIIEGFQRLMDDRPHLVLLEEQQETIIKLRMEIEEDNRTLIEAEMLKEELKEIKKAKADLEEKLNEKDKDLLESNSAKRAINELYQESQKQRQDLMEQFEKKQERWEADVARLKEEIATLREALELDRQANLLMKLHEGVERVHKRISEDVQSGVKIVSEEIRKMTDQLPDTESKMDLLENENISLKLKLAAKVEEVKQLTKKLEVVVETVQSKKKEEELLIYRVREEMKEQHMSMMIDQQMSIMKKQQISMIKKQQMSIMKKQQMSMIKKQQMSMMKEFKQQMSMMKEQQMSMMKEQQMSMMKEEQMSMMKELLAELKGHSQDVLPPSDTVKGEEYDVEKETLRAQVEDLQKQLKEKLQTQDLSQQLSQSKECIKALENILNNLVLEEKMADKVSSDVGNVCEAEDLGALAHEAELEKLCWIPFGIQTLTVGEEGGLFPLQPQTTEVYKDNDVIALEVPEGAVNTAVCDRLCIRYGVIVFGPFDLPEGYQLGSMAVYIYFNQNHAVKPVVLHLPHWSGKDGESSLKCVVAPHRPEEVKKYKFKDVEEEDFQSKEGCCLITVDGHCSLFAEAFEDGFGSDYLATSLIEECEKSLKAVTKVAVTHSSCVWIEILKKYCKGFKVEDKQRFSFKSEDAKVSLKLIEERGPGWEAVVLGYLLPKDVLFETYKIRSCKRLKKAVKNELYPPCLTCKVTYSREAKELGKYKNVKIFLAGTEGPPDCLGFTCPTYEERAKERDAPIGMNSPPHQMLSTPTHMTGPASIDHTTSVSPTSNSPPFLLTNRPSKELRVQHLMPYIPDLAACGLGIAGYLGLTTVWASIEISLKDPHHRLQELLTKWLDDREQETSPHTWEFFVDVVRKVGKGKLADRIVHEIFTEPQDSSLSSVESGLDRPPQTQPSQTPTEVEENGHFNGQ